MEHLQRAEHLWVQQMQKQCFRKEYNLLKAGQPVPKSSLIFQLDPIIEDKILRVRGRIDAASVPRMTKRPMIIDGYHPLATLIIQNEHIRAHHANNERVINELRQRYWILRLRPTVRA